MRIVTAFERRSERTTPGPMVMGCLGGTNERQQVAAVKELSEEDIRKATKTGKCRAERF